MLHFTQHCALQTEHVSGKRVVQNLAATVIEHLVTERPTAEHRVEMFTACPLTQKTRAGLNSQFVGLERFHECNFFRGEFAQSVAPAQRAKIARRKLTVGSLVSKNHGST